MKYTKILCLVILMSLLASPFANFNINAQEEKCPVLRGNFEYQGIVHEQKFRKKLIPSFYDDVSHPLYDVFGGFKHRSFLFCFDSCDDDDEDIDQLVIIYGLGTLRNAPLYSIDFEYTELGGVYGINVSHEKGVNWITMSPDVMDDASPEYDKFYSAIYTMIINQTYLTHTEIYKPRNPSLPYTLSIIYEDWDLWGFTENLENIVLVDLTKDTGNVGTWQQINKDETVINGNFTTFGPENPIFVSPQDENNTALWWPTYNISIAVNVERTSLPRTNSFEIDYSLIGVLLAFSILSTVFVITRRIRRSKK
ncbi:MAG: hypothetical protein ACW96U_11250 [Candidatus Heimdallarchaeaceae archaeon]